MAWPDTARKRLTYVLVAPLLIPMWLTLPDTRTPKGKKLFPVTFIGSILWIAAFSYLMVWWANVAGDTARIPPEVSERVTERAAFGKKGENVFTISSFSFRICGFKENNLL